MKQMADKVTNLEIETTLLLYKSGIFAVFAILVASIIFVNYLWSDVNHTVLVIWFTFLQIFNLTRFVSMYYFKNYVIKRDYALINFKFWKLLFLTGIQISGLTWSFTMFFPFERNTLIHMYFILIMLLFLNSGTVVLNSTSLISVYTYIIITLLPAIVRFFIFTGSAGYSTSLMIIIYILLMFRITHSLNDTIITNIKLKLENRNHSLLDPLTQLWNRRHLYLVIDKLTAQCRRENQVLSLVMIDIDFFKDYNDHNGHNMGDQLLKEIARILITEIRENDIAVRYGGEEFLIIFPATGKISAKATIERIRKLVKDSTSVTISAGIAEYTGQPNFDQLVEEADLALYKSKTGGRNRTTLFSKSLIKTGKKINT